MIDLDFVQKLIQTVDESSIDNVEIERGGTRIRVSKTPDGLSYSAGPPPPNPSPAPPQATSASPGNSNPSDAAPAPAAETEDRPRDDDWVEITSPMVGTFYRAASPGADPFIDVGGRITEGSTLCIIEAMKLMNELEAEIEGTVREVLAENGEPVEYGQPLFRVEPS